MIFQKSTFRCYGKTAPLPSLLPARRLRDFLSVRQHHRVREHAGAKVRLDMPDVGSRHRMGAGFTLSVSKQEHRLSHLKPFVSLAHNPLILRMRASYQMICRLFGARPKTANSFQFFNAFLLSVNLAPVLCRDPILRMRRAKFRCGSITPDRS